jgi:hypothetical protein
MRIQLSNDIEIQANLLSKEASNISGVTVPPNTFKKAIQQMKCNTNDGIICTPEQLNQFCDGLLTSLVEYDSELNKPDLVYKALAKITETRCTRSLMASLSFNNPENINSINIPAPGNPSQDILTLRGKDKATPKSFLSRIFKKLKNKTINPSLEADGITFLCNDAVTSNSEWHGHHRIKLSFIGDNESFDFVVRRGSVIYTLLKQAIAQNQESSLYIEAARAMYPNHVVMQFIEQDYLLTVPKEIHETLISSPQLLGPQYRKLLISHHVFDRF